MKQAYRINGGLVNKSKPIKFTFNNKQMTGYEGDTLASALLANGQRLVGRSFKYHRPRGIFSSGSEEPNVGHEGGARVSLSQLRSSHAIAQLSDFVLGLEVDREDPTSGLRNLVCLKNRHRGEVGHAGTLSYDRTTGRLTDAGANFGF